MRLPCRLSFTRARLSTSGRWSALRHRSANMNTLIALGTGAAFLYSLVGDSARRARGVFRSRGGDHRADPAGPDAGGARARQGFGRHPPADGSAAADRARGAATARKSDMPDRAGAARATWWWCGPGERIPVDGAVRRRRLGGGRIHADRREHAGGQETPAIAVLAAPSTAPAAFASRRARWGAARCCSR